MGAKSLDLGAMLSLVWSSSLAGRAFLIAAGVVILALVVVLARSRMLLAINTTELLRQIEKLIAAGNIDRAVKLAKCHEGPVMKLVRTGLVSAVSSKERDGLSSRATGEMERELPVLKAWATRFSAPVILLALVTMPLGLATLAGPAREAWMLCAGLLAVLAVLAGSVVRDSRRYDRDLRTVVDSLSKALKLEELR